MGLGDGLRPYRAGGKYKRYECYCEHHEMVCIRGFDELFTTTTTTVLIGAYSAG